MEARSVHHLMVVFCSPLEGAAVLYAAGSVPAVVCFHQQRFALRSVSLEHIHFIGCVEAEQAGALAIRVAVPVELVPIPVKPGPVNVRLKLPTIRNGDFMPQHSLVLVGRHHVLR